MKKYYFSIGLIIIGLLYFVLRFYQLSQNFVFRPDQGLHLLESYEMVQSHKIRLLGPIVSSKNFDNRNFFIGANYYYALAFLGQVTKWDPLVLTVLYNVIEFFFVLFFVFWLKKKFSSPISLVIFTFLAVFPYLLSHSHFYWNPHFLLPLAIMEIYLLDLYFKNKKNVTIFLAAIVWGCAFAFHYAAILWFFAYLYIIYRKKIFSHLYIYPTIAIGFIVGDLPFVISELRHNFYNIRTMIFVYTHSSDSSRLYGHYFIYPFIIFLLFTVAYFLKKYWNSKIFVTALLFTLISMAILIPPVDELSSIPGWRYPNQLKALSLILSPSCPKNFNLATTISGDTRTYDLRALLNIKACPPNSVDNYPQSSTIFLIAPPTRPPETETVWEISSFKPFKVSEKIIINDNVIFYRLDKS